MSFSSCCCVTIMSQCSHCKHNLDIMSFTCRNGASVSLALKRLHWNIYTTIHSQYRLPSSRRHQDAHSRNTWKEKKFFQSHFLTTLLSTHCTSSICMFYIDRTNLVSKEFIIWILVKCSLQDTAGSPERARQLHLPCSGSQSQRRIWFIFPAHTKRAI